MYKCIDCGTVFKHPETWQESRGEYWGMPCSETVSGCPVCRGDYEEVFKCEACDEYFPEDEMEGNLCESCYEDILEKEN